MNRHDFLQLTCVICVTIATSFRTESHCRAAVPPKELSEGYIQSIEIDHETDGTVLVIWATKSANPTVEENGGWNKLCVRRANPARKELAKLSAVAFAQGFKVRWTFVPGSSEEVRTLKVMRTEQPSATAAAKQQPTKP